MANIEKFRTPASQHKRELEEGLADTEVEQQLLKVANGVRRRISLIESSPDSDHDIENHIRYKHLVHKEKMTDQEPLEPETKDYERGGWEIHFRKHLDTLDLPDLLAETEKYLQIIATDSSAIQEYRLCIQLLDRIAAAGIESAAFRIRDGIIEVITQDRAFHFPINVKLESKRDVHCRAVGLEHKQFIEAYDYYTKNLEACRRIIETKDIDGGFDILLERMGYNVEMTPEDKETFKALIDTDLIAQAIQNIDVHEYTQYGFRDTHFMNEFAPGRNNDETLVVTMLREWTNDTESNRINLSQILGRMLGKIAARTCTLQIEESTFIIASGILKDPKIRQAFETRSKEASKEKWFDTEIDPIRDMKVKTLYEFTRNAIDNGADLETKMKWADYIDSPDFQLDMTRGNDPTIFYEDVLSGVPEHQGKSAGYEPGIYCGVLGAFYNWSDTHKAIIRRMPLKYVDDIRGRGEAVIMCKELKPKKINESVSKYPDGLVYMGYVLLDASEAEVVPYDNPESVEHDSVAYFDTHVPTRFLPLYQQYFPGARIENKTLKSKVTGQTVELPFLILPAEARRNLVKVEYLKRSSGIGNVVIE